MMDKEQRDYLLQHIKVQFDKNPEVSGKEAKKWILSGKQPVNLGTIGQDTL